MAHSIQAGLVGLMVIIQLALKTSIQTDDIIQVIFIKMYIISSLESQPWLSMQIVLWRNIKIIIVSASSNKIMIQDYTHICHT